MTAAPHGFRHEALLYAGDDEFVAAAVPFLKEGVAAGDAALVAVDAAKIARLREALGDDADGVRFADMHQLGANPALIISAWHEFAAANRAAGRGLRGIGEPVWAGRTPAQLVECQRHESLLNLAFADEPGFTLLCPYDTQTLAPEVVDAAARSHPVVVEGGTARASAIYEDLDAVAAPFAQPLPAPPADTPAVDFDMTSLAAVRRAVATRAAAAGMRETAVDDLVLAVSELAANSVRHGGGAGRMRLWAEEESVVCQVEDAGAIPDPLVGRIRPAVDQVGGYGVWIANQLCDLVQIRSYPAATVVRVHKRVAG